MTTIRTKATAILTGFVALAALTACGPSQQEKDKAAATDVATKFVAAPYDEKCRYEAKNSTAGAIEHCMENRGKDPNGPMTMPFDVQAVEPWGEGYAVKLKGEGLEGVFVLGIVKVGNEWKVAEDQTTSDQVAAQSGWACRVIGGPDCGGGSK